jgi:integrase
MSELYRKKGKNGKLSSPFWYFTITVNGKRVRGSTKETRKVRAQEVLAEKREKARDHGIVSLNRKAPTLAEFSVDFLKWVEDSHSIRPQTKRFYRHGCGLLKATRLADIKLDAITNSDCETATFPGGDCHANQALRTLRRMMSLAKEARLMFGELPRIKTRKVWPRSVAMSLADSELIAAKMPDGDPRDVFLVLRGSGMRPSECYAMRWEFLSLDRGEYKNPHGKTTTARRSCPLLHNSLAILQRRHLAQGLPREGYIFPSDSVTGHVVGIGKAFRAARKAAGLPDSMVLYTARHGVGTELAQILSLKEVMDLLGHTDARTALGYQHPLATNLQARLDEARTNGRIM